MIRVILSLLLLYSLNAVAKKKRVPAANEISIGAAVLCGSGSSLEKAAESLNTKLVVTGVEKGPDDGAGALKIKLSSSNYYILAPFSLSQPVIKKEGKNTKLCVSVYMSSGKE